MSSSSAMRGSRVRGPCLFILFFIKKNFPSANKILNTKCRLLQIFSIGSHYNLVKNFKTKELQCVTLNRPPVNDCSRISRVLVEKSETFNLE